MSSSTSITVRGKPAPQGSKRHVGNGIMIESSKAVGPWREAVRTETQHVVQEKATGPLHVTLVFTLPRPQGHYRSGRNSHLLRDTAPAYPAGKPDLDKLARAVLDGLTEGGAWEDDSQVVHLDAWKVYGARWEHGGCRIEIFGEDCE